MSLSFRVEIAYQRHRPDTRGDKFEARLDSFGLLVAGAVIALAIVIIVLPRLLDALGHI